MTTHVWDWFTELRKSCMPFEVVAPITWGEINEFEYAQGLHIRPWEKQLIRDIDDIARVIWIKRANPKERPVLNEIDVNDSDAVGSFLRGKAAQQKEG